MDVHAGMLSRRSALPGQGRPVFKAQGHGRMFGGPHMVIFTVDKQSSTTFPTASRFSSGFPAETAVRCARLVAAALLLSWAVAAADAASDAETRKIQALIASVERMDATFVRNGTTYDAKTAAEFLRRKWKAHDADVATAKDFIEKIASTSSTSGKPYLIRFKDGREVQSGEHLRAELAKLEAPP